MISNEILSKTSAPFQPLTRRQREDVADALSRAGCPERAHHCAVVDPNSEPHALVVLASTPEEARLSWERYAEGAGLTGRHRLAITATQPAKGGQRKPERTVTYVVDLDLLHADELKAFAERALGM